jgi:hypothetical protein
LGAVTSVDCLFSLFETLYQLQSVFNDGYLCVWLSGKQNSVVQMSGPLWNALKYTIVGLIYLITCI